MLCRIASYRISSCNTTRAPAHAQIPNSGLNTGRRIVCAVSVVAQNRGLYVRTGPSSGPESAVEDSCPFVYTAMEGIMDGERPGCARVSHRAGGKSARFLRCRFCLDFCLGWKDGGI